MTTPPSDIDTLGVEEAAVVMRADRTTVLAMIHTGELPADKFGRAWVILKSDLAKCIAERIKKATSERRACREAIPASRATGRPRRALPTLPGEKK